jgi:ribosome recycling factor
VKLLSTFSEGAKKRIRDLRQTALEACKAAVKDNDVRKQNERQLQFEIETLNNKIESMLASKQRELLSQ